MDIESIKRLSLSGRTNDVSRNDMFRSAAMSGDRETFERLLRNQEVDVYAKDSFGNTALMLVASNGHVECLKCLVDANKIRNINKCNRKQFTPLMLAAMNGHIECVRCLIETGLADVNVCGWNGYTVLLFVAENGQAECLKYLVDANKIENINQCGRDQRTALMLAAMNGHIDCVRYLIDAGLADVNLCDRHGYTALKLIAEKGHAECLKYLVDANKIENINQCGRDQRTALMLAALNGHIECVRYLIDTGLADVNLCDRHGYTALMFVAEKGYAECLHYFVDGNKIENINQRGRYQRTALMLAGENGHIECVRYLINTGLADLNLHNYEGNTALMLVARSGHFECLKYLMSGNIFGNINECNKNQRTAIMLAAENGHTECVRSLIETGQSDVNLCDRNGNTALMLIAENGHVECLNYLVGTNKVENGHIECERILKSEEMVGLNVRNKEGHTAFMLASMNGHIQCVKLLLSHDKVDVNMRDNEGRTALMLAILKHRYECVQCLISNEIINVAERDNDGRTAFMLAACMSNVHCLQYFFEITVSEEMNLTDDDKNKADQRKDKFSTVISRPYKRVDGYVRYYPEIKWRRPYIYGRDQEGKSVLKLVIRNCLPRCVVCFLLAGIDVSLSENVSCSHTLIDKGELSDLDKNGQTTLIAAVQRRDYESIDYLLQYERIRFHILVILLREEFCATGTISLQFYNIVCTLIRSLKEVDQFMVMICNDAKVGVCVDYLLSTFICQIDSSNQSALSLAIPMQDPTQLRILLEHVSEKNILINHIEVSCRECPITEFNIESILELLKSDIFLWNWYPKFRGYTLNVLTRELVIRGFAPGCFEWQDKKCSPIHFAFIFRDLGRIRYLVANLYLTSRDLEHIQRDTIIHSYFQQQGSVDLQRVYWELFGTPWRLETQSLLTISNWMRKKINQKCVEKVYSLLPEIFQSRLPFSNPMRLICHRQWLKIDLDFLNHRLSTSLSDVNLFQGKCCNGGCLKLDDDDEFPDDDVYEFPDPDIG